ncbi:MAG TPA: polysaccharide biosynthesis tyrosine autokinase [Nitrospirae bacterium]|nr:tyrosine-protein kinase YwqD [bacterium BMS3Abin10]GBE38254.1 tyrosine-protein kinase YwqD [bacterium BMS3Bbin08]HDH49929.1 polysaccharide biosynthesis tyrosine autokinase [Nitrospirota bacterium]HDK17505.1 polysaccharide biosynthesis tyrosine autokinase [Nitrospirota bacterium]HDO25786.1 polysaccharide biosynthesis tyrosine autokinase [Nitrospirota bacterium]
MSRIEKAIEKASKMRDSMETGKAVTVPDKENRPENKAVLDKKAVTVSDKVNIVNPYVITLNNPGSPISEQYRNLKSMVVRLTQKQGFKNTLMVTSTSGSEGKSLTAVNLAITLAQEYDHTVLLVDADFRNPSLHRYLNINPEIGLSDYLINGHDIGMALIKTGIGKLTFLPTGRNVADPAEILSSRKMKELINEMKHRYSDRYIIIDTPPVLPFAETRSIGAVVDSTIFVVKEGMVPLYDIKDALDILKDCNILGMVYNDAGFENLRGHYSYYYKQYSGNGDGA